MELRTAVVDDVVGALVALSSLRPPDDFYEVVVTTQEIRRRMATASVLAERDPDSDEVAGISELIREHPNPEFARETLLRPSRERMTTPSSADPLLLEASARVGLEFGFTPPVASFVALVQFKTESCAVLSPRTVIDGMLGDACELVGMDVEVWNIEAPTKDLREGSFETMSLAEARERWR